MYGIRWCTTDHYNAPLSYGPQKVDVGLRKPSASRYVGVRIHISPSPLYWIVFRKDNVVTGITVGPFQHSVWWQRVSTLHKSALRSLTLIGCGDDVQILN